MNDASRVQRLRARAEECRVYAYGVNADHDRNDYLALAAAYDGLARDQEILGRIQQRGLNLKRELSRLSLFRAQAGSPRTSNS
jgi:hypothetical protein